MQNHGSLHFPGKELQSWTELSNALEALGEGMVLIGPAGGAQGLCGISLSQQKKSRKVFLKEVSKDLDLNKR